MTRLARTLGSAASGCTLSAARKILGSVRPSMPAPPICNALRRGIIKLPIELLSGLERPRVPVGRNADRVTLRVRRDRELDIVALAFALFVGDVFVRNVACGPIGTQVLVDLINGL